MATGQRLRGLIGQAMSGRRRPPTSYTYNFPAGVTSTWTCPANGWWRIALWGPGGKADNASTTGGGGGAFYMADRLFTTGQTVSFVVGTSTSGNNSTATLPSGEVLTAGFGASGLSGGAGGTATANRVTDTALGGGAGGVSAAGSAGSGTGAGSGGSGSGGGGGAGGQLPYRGSAGQNTNSNTGRAPGGGGSVDTGTGSHGGDGMALISRVRFNV